VIGKVVERTVTDRLGIPFGLRQHTLRPEGQLFSLDNPDDPPIDTEGIVGGAVCRLVLLNGARAVVAKRLLGRKGNDLPTRRLQLGVDEALPGEPFGVAF